MKPNNYFERAGTIAASGAGTILGTQSSSLVYAFYEMQIQLEGTGPQTFIIQGGSVQPRVYCANAGDGMIKVWDNSNEGEALWRTQPGSALIFDSSGSAQYNYFVRGFSEPVY